MLFSSLTFLFVFLPLVFLTYYANSNRNYRNFILFSFSIFFYSWGEPVYVVLMFISIINDYFHSIYIDKAKKSDKEYIAKILLTSSIFINLGLLGYFKYFDFLIVNTNMLLGASFQIKNIALPIGISFYTFQTMSYTIDVYFGKVKVQKNILTLATYVALFPQLIAGPIVRYSTIEDELVNRNENLSQIANGFRRFIIGLAKKVIIANQVAIVANEMFSTNANELSIAMAWIGVIAYAFQIYFDFSGYSDMAIGLGAIFGFTFLENFNYPYISKSITEFWRRWHISMGTWFRDYLYIPLGGNKKGMRRWLINVMIVWFATGLWHGAAWNFVIWGLYFGVILMLEKVFLLSILKKNNAIAYMYTIFIVLIGWVIFRSESLEGILLYINSMFRGYALVDMIKLQKTSIMSLWPYFILATIGSTPLFSKAYNMFNNSEKYALYVDIYIVVVLIVSFMFLVSSSYNPFIYFRF